MAYMCSGTASSIRSSLRVTARQSDVRADLDVIAGDVKLAAAEGVDAADRERVGGDAFDACADGVEKATEILDVRLGCRVVDQRVALG